MQSRPDEVQNYCHFGRPRTFVTDGCRRMGDAIMGVMDRSSHAGSQNEEASCMRSGPET